MRFITRICGRVKNKDGSITPVLALLMQHADGTWETLSQRGVTK